MAAPAPGYVPIADYGVIGDCRSAALVSRAGSIDWICLPRFSDPAVFAAILDPERAGRFSIRPRGRFDVSRRYTPRTNVLETTFSAESGTLRLIDCMPVSSEETKRRELLPEREVLRSVECTSGAVEIDIRCEPRPDFGRRGLPRASDRGRAGIRFEHPRQRLHLLSEIPLEVQRSAATGTITLHAGDRRFLSLTSGEEEPFAVPPLGDHAQERLDRTIRWWRDWSGRCTYDGPYQDAVLRSALVLKLMAFTPSGAIIAAPTTSLPEVIGGGHNWDYRYCWLRDASLTMRALLGLGYGDEAGAFLDWLLHATRLTAPRLQVVYDVWGRHRLPERTLEHLRGYENSRPVRTGNAAWKQFQLDIYGPVIQAGYEFIAAGGRVDDDQRRFLAQFAGPLVKLWDRPDHGIWESRGQPKRHTYSMAMSWVGLDRLRRMHDNGELKLRKSEEVAAARDTLRRKLDAAGADPETGAYTAVLGEPGADASLLMLIIAGYLDPSSPLAKATLRAVDRQLGDGPFIYRSPKHRKEESAFGICSFWAAETEALTGDIEAAESRFEKLLAAASDLGLYAEEIEPRTGAHIGNFPQAFTHLALINAAITLRDARKKGARRAAADQDRGGSRPVQTSHPLTRGA